MSVADEVEKLRRLRDEGTLTENEFAAAKARLLRDDAESDFPQIRLIRRSRTDRWLGGVCGGFARSIEIESWILRLLMTLLVLCFGVGIVAYLLCWIFVPVEGGGPKP
ncbi:MAG TPA: PspC domain-containing protein [Rhodocyclaceae bacterium]|nr:PspC domain-containing protein [Rhodocyclaceae bacterium]